MDGERDDAELMERLARANPVDPASVPGPGSARARAVLEEILMQPTPVASEPATLRARRRPVLAAAAVLAVLGVAVGVGVTLGGDDGDRDEVVAPDTGGTGSTAPSLGASCVELYSLETIANREVAFSGTLTALDGTRATFAVERWFRGGDGSTVTLDDATGGGGPSSVNPEGGIGLEVGGRYLVAGDGGFAWGCGFTQPYDPGVAAAWEDALA